MAGFLPDPVIVDVLWQGDLQPCRVRLTLPDGSGDTGLLDFEALSQQASISQQPWDAERAQRVGQALFAGLFPGNCSNQFNSALIASKERGIRLMLHLDEGHPSLHRIPWERLYHPQGNLWVPSAAAPNIFFSRHLQTGKPWGLPLPTGPLKVLAVISSPFPQGNNLYVNAALEQQSAEKLFDNFPGQVEYEFLSGQITVQQITDRLNQGQGFDILYYVGHGDWRAEEQTGYLILSKRYEDGTVGPAGVAAAELVQMLSTLQRLPQLVFLSACESGQQSTHAAFAGVGPSLVQAGCPAVVCMQEKVENAVAREFAHSFFASLLETGCIDLAVNQARKRLLDHPYSQWAVPVLYMHQLDGILFVPEQRFKPAQRNPYKFLAPYQRDDHDLFKGRSQLISAVTRHIRDFAVTVLYGDSGVGLTSLMEAGVRPILEADGWLVASIAKYDDIASEFRLQVRVNGKPVYLKVPGDALLPDVIRAAGAGTFPNVVVFLDQFERVFLMQADGQQAVLKALEDSLGSLGSRLKFVLILHKDAAPNLTQFQRVLDSRAGPWIEIPPLDTEGAVEAILSPLDVLGWPVTLSPAFAREHIAPDLNNLYEADPAEGQAWVDPGQLQITCTWLYQKAHDRKPPLIDEALYLKEAGGADGILVRYMEDELETRFADQSLLAKAILVAMAAPDMQPWIYPDAILPKIPARVDGVGADLPALDTQATPTGDPLTTVTLILDRLVKAELLERRLVNNRYAYSFTNQTIAEEARRLGGKLIEQAYNSGDELERIWRLWLASLARSPQGSTYPDPLIATRHQLRLLDEYGQHLDSRPVKILLLLRAAVGCDEPPMPWINRLIQKEKAHPLIQSLEIPGAKDGNPMPTSSAMELAGRILGLSNPDLPRMPAQAEGFGQVAWSAASSPNPIDRRTAALALTVLPMDTPDLVTRLAKAIDALPAGTQRFWRKLELFGALEDSGADRKGSHPANIRYGIYLWRVWQRILHNRRWITWTALGGGIGAALGLGIERLLVGLLTQSHVATVFFALFSYWGALIAGFTSLGVAISGPLLLESPPGKSEHPSKTRLQILVGIVLFGLVNAFVAILNNIRLDQFPFLIPFGLVAGIGFSIAIAGKIKRKPVGWLFRALVGAVPIAMVQGFFLVFPSSGSGISIALSAGFFQVEFAHFQAAFWQKFIQSFPDWMNLLALVEAFLSGFAMTLGTLIGRNIAADWYEQWKDALDRISG